MGRVKKVNPTGPESNPRNEPYKVPGGTMTAKQDGSIAEIRTNWHVEKTHGKGQGVGDLEKEGREQELKAGKGNAGWGNKIHVDHTPTDDQGHKMEGADDADFQNTYDKAWDRIPKVDDMYIYTTWELDGISQDPRVILGSESDNFGCTPTLKLNKQHEDSKDHVLTFRGHYGKDVHGPECRVSIS